MGKEIVDITEETQKSEEGGGTVEEEKNGGKSKEVTRGKMGILPKGEKWEQQVSSGNGGKAQPNKSPLGRQ